VRHARVDDLEPLVGLLEELRALDRLTERKPGNFSRGSAAFLHFHVDPAGMFADVKIGGEFERFRVSTAAEQKRVLAVVRRVLRH
jgi:hypothetical protein